MRYTIFFISSLFLFALNFGCRRKLTDTSLQRTEASMQRFADVLSTASDGWNVCVFDKDDNYYHFWMRFFPDGQVEMKADFDKFSGRIRRSQYAVRDLQQPTLTFATYNYISNLADPDKAKGKTKNIDIQYAFTEDLVKQLAEIKDHKVAEFTLLGRLHNSRAYFSRVEPQYGVVVDTTLSIQMKLDSLRWQDSANVNLVTMAGVDAHGGGGGMTSENTWMYDWHLQDGFYPGVVGITSFKRKGCALSYKIDCKGHVVFRPAGKEVALRTSFVDQNMTEQWTQGYYHAFRWQSDTIRLAFTHTMRDGRRRELMLQSTSLSKIGSLVAELHGTGNSYAQTDTGIFAASGAMQRREFAFMGFTARNTRDAWNLQKNGSVKPSWNNAIYSEKDYSPTLELAFTYLGSPEYGPPFGLGFVEHPTNQPYDFLFRNGTYFFLMVQEDPVLNNRWSNSSNQNNKLPSDRPGLKFENRFRKYLMDANTNTALVTHFFSPFSHGSCSNCQQNTQAAAQSTTTTCNNCQNNNRCFCNTGIDRASWSWNKSSSTWSQESAPTHPAITQKDHWFTLLPTVLGFQLHRRGSRQDNEGSNGGSQEQPSGVMAPLYFIASQP